MIGSGGKIPRRLFFIKNKKETKSWPLNKKERKQNWFKLTESEGEIIQRLIASKTKASERVYWLYFFKSIELQYSGGRGFVVSMQIMEEEGPW